MTDHTTEPTADQLEAHADELEAQAREVRRRQAARDAERFAEREIRAVVFAEERLAAYHPETLQRETRAAQTAFFDAVVADPVWSALIDWKAAERRAIRAGNTAAMDRGTILRARGDHTPQTFDAPYPGAITVELVTAVLDRALQDVTATEGDLEQEAQREALDVGLTNEQVQRFEEELELARRRAEVQRSSAPMTPQEREKAGLPPTGSGRQGYPETGGFRDSVAG